jgi:cell fate regulator YaaT (PSP1 superfamily)
MACSSCGTKSGGGCAPSGCKSNGTCGTSGCNALNVYDWFKDMDLPEGFKPFDIVEVRFKGSRKEFFRNSNDIDLFTGDYVVVESSIGFDVGTVSATGEIVRLQLKKYRVREDDENLPSIVRVATEKDLERYEECKAKEDDMLERARTIAFGLNLQMKISDIELQGDGRKVIFFYTAETRVDFRELIKKYAEDFRVKIEMRHISYREEASRLGGIGVCGRELCCSTWLTDYKQVNTGAARVQNLSINMEKLAGQCGRLKCCLNFELDLYLEAVNEFPKAKIVKLETTGGVAYARKTDILKKLIWFSYDNSQTWVPLAVDQVNALMEENKNGVQVPQLADLAPAVELLDKIIEKESEFMTSADLLKDNEFKDLKDLPSKKGGNNNNNRNQRNGSGSFNNRNRSNDNRNDRRQGQQGPQGQGRAPENRGPRPNQTDNSPNRENNSQNRENTAPNRENNAENPNPNRVNKPKFRPHNKKKPDQ